MAGQVLLLAPAGTAGAAAPEIYTSKSSPQHKAAFFALLLIYQYPGGVCHTTGGFSIIPPPGSLNTYSGYALISSPLHGRGHPINLFLVMRRDEACASQASFWVRSDKIADTVTRLGTGTGDHCPGRYRLPEGR